LILVGLSQKLEGHLDLWVLKLLLDIDECFLSWDPESYFLKGGVHEEIDLHVRDFSNALQPNSETVNQSFKELVISDEIIEVLWGDLTSCFLFLLVFRLDFLKHSQCHFLGELLLCAVYELDSELREQVLNVFNVLCVWLLLCFLLLGLVGAEERDKGIVHIGIGNIEDYLLLSNVSKVDHLELVGDLSALSLNLEVQGKERGSLQEGNGLEIARSKLNLEIKADLYLCLLTGRLAFWRLVTSLIWDFLKEHIILLAH
jgi:hypothetical protein